MNGRTCFSFTAFPIVALTAAVGLSAPIGSNDVARAMGNWRSRYGTLGAKMGMTVKDVRKVTNGEKAVYIVRFEGGGHLIAPTDTNIRPVIMFSDGIDFDPDPNNPAWDLIGGSREPVKAAAASNSGDDPDGGETDESPSAAKNRAQWAELLNDGNDDKPDFSEYNVDEVRVAPLTTTIWAQRKSMDGESGYYGNIPCFNYYTPSNYPCGCVATATAQILRKFAYMGPNAYMGTFTNTHTEVDGVETPMTTIGAPYDWANMPDVPKSEKECEAVGHLTSDVGIMIGMDYTSSGSGSKTYMGKLVFEKFFGYSSAMAMRGGSPYTGHDDLFERLFVSNFDAKLPVQIGLSGHSIIGDGYGYTGGTIYYHLNFGWGWGGYWYNTPDDLIKEGSKYTGFIGAVYNIYTNQNYSAETVIASGRVTRGGRAAAGVRVSAAATDDPETEVASATTDEKGIYALFVPAGEYKVTAVAEQGERYEVSGETIARPFTCVSTIPVENGHYNYVSPDEASVGNAAHCDIALEAVLYEPEAEVTVGEVSGQTNFTCATIPVTAKVVHYGQTATSAKVVVTVSPVDGGGAAVMKEFTIGGDFDEHDFNAAFEGLLAGEKYMVTARVKMNTDEPAGLGDGGSFTESREFVWFDESATSFTTTKWSGGEVKVEDGGLFVGANDGAEATFAPESAVATFTHIVIKIRKSGAYAAETIPFPDGLAAVSAIFRTDDRAELVVWGNNVWNSTGIMFDDENANIDVTVDIDFLHHCVKYGLDGSVLGAYNLPNSVTPVSSVSFKGYTVLSELQGTVWDANLVRDADGAEFTNYEAAKAAGETGVLSPLWLSTWNLAGGSGTLDVSDPKGLITFTGASKVLKSETNTQGVVTHWYAEASAADIEAGAREYVKTTVNLGLAKAITDNSVIKIGDFAVAEGSVTFKVKIDNVEVLKAAINDLVEVSGDLDAWARPADKDIDFDAETHIVTVTPPAGLRGFVRIKIK